MNKVVVILFALFLSACSHTLEVRNLRQVGVPVSIQSTERPLQVGIAPFSGYPEDAFYFNAIVNHLAHSGAVDKLQTDYYPGRTVGFTPDVVIEIRARANHRASWWNLPIQFPGFLIFTSAWNGYVYHAGTDTVLSFSDAEGKKLGEVAVPVDYSLRHAEFDRTWTTGWSWIMEPVLVPIGSGIYYSTNFDKDLLGEYQQQVERDYATTVGKEALRFMSGIEAGVRAPGKPSSGSIEY